MMKVKMGPFKIRQVDMPTFVRVTSERYEHLLRVARAAQEAETLLTNYLIENKFPTGSDCWEVKKILYEALEEVKDIL